MEKRKRGHPPLPKNIEEYVITAAMKNPDMKRLALAEKVKQELEDKGLTPPARATMLKLFQKAPDKTEEDKPWSLGKSVQYGLSPEASDDLILMWSWCLAAGLEFTIRHAKWVCYLRNAWKGWSHDGDPACGILYDWCQSYSNKERICQALAVDFETHHLDATWLLGPSWEYYTALQVGELQKFYDESIPLSLPNFNIQKPVDTWGSTAGDIVQKKLMLEDYNFSIGNFRLKGEAGRVYAYWLRFISKSDYWKNAQSFEEQSRIAANLREDIANQADKNDSGSQYIPVEALKARDYKFTEEQSGGTK